MVFDKYTARYKKELDELTKELVNYSISSSNLETASEKCLRIAQHINSAWISAGFKNKQWLQKLIFPDGIMYNKVKGVVRTSNINSLLPQLSH